MKNKMLLLDWEVYIDVCNKLADKIDKDICGTKEERRAYRVFGISRGGYIPAVIVAHRLNCEMTIDPYKADIIIDDLIDTGKSAERLLGFLNKDVHFYVVYDKTKLSYVAPIQYRGYACRAEHDDWLVFPYETEESTKR